MGVQLTEQNTGYKHNYGFLGKTYIKCRTFFANHNILTNCIRKAAVSTPLTCNNCQTSVSMTNTNETCTFILRHQSAIVPSKSAPGLTLTVNHSFQA